MRIVALLALLICWSAACEGKEPVTQDPKALAPTHGYVFANAPKGADLLEITPVAGGKAVRLVERAESAAAQGVWVQEGDHLVRGVTKQGLWVPEGEYFVSRWGDATWQPEQRFRVQAGRVTDLGSLVTFGIGASYRIFASLRPVEETHAIDGVLKEFDAVLSQKEPISWHQSKPSDPSRIAIAPGDKGLIPDLFRSAAFKNSQPPLVRSLLAAATPDQLLADAREITSPITEEAAIDESGRLYFGADLGVLRIRTPDARWTSVAMDTLHKISAVEWSDGMLVTGSDDGVLRRSKDGGGSWSELNRIGGEAIIDIDHADGVWLLTTSRAQGPQIDRISVYKASQADLSDLVKLRDFAVEQKRLAYWFGARPQTRGQKFTLGIERLYQLDIPTMAWNELPVPFDVSTFWIDEKSGAIAALNSGFRQEIATSLDNGKSWTKIKHKPKFRVVDVQFEGKDRGYASRLFQDPTTSYWNTYDYDPTDEDWRVTSRAPSNCEPLRVSMSMPVLCLQSDGSIQRLEFDGNWTVEVDAHFGETP